jgi:4-hydroxy-3-methylbut-2-en-1-yl diphosphate synthase IspG/GcpE
MKVSPKNYGNHNNKKVGYVISLLKHLGMAFRVGNNSVISLRKRLEIASTISEFLYLVSSKNIDENLTKKESKTFQEENS